MAAWLSRSHAAALVALALLGCGGPTSPSVVGVVGPKAQPLRAVAPPVVVEAPSQEGRDFFLAHLSQPPLDLAPIRVSRVTRIALENTARGETSGMTAMGEALGAQLAEGERARMPVRLDSGDCVTFLAQGGLGVIEVDLFLTVGEGERLLSAAGEREELLILGDDRDEGPIAIIGGREGCFRSQGSVPLDATLQVVMRRGSGVVLVQGYRK